MRKAKPPNHSAGRGRHRARSVQNTPPARQDASTRRAVTLRQSSVDESVERPTGKTKVRGSIPCNSLNFLAAQRCGSSLQNHRQDSVLRLAQCDKCLTGCLDSVVLCRGPLVRGQGSNPGTRLQGNVAIWPNRQDSHCQILAG